MKCSSATAQRRILALLFGVMIGAALVAISRAAHAIHETPTPITPPKLVKACFAGPDGTAPVQVGQTLYGGCYYPDFVEALIRQQPIGALQYVVRTMQAPMFTAGVKVGEVVGASINPSQTPAGKGGPFLAGRVTELAAKVQIRVDGGAYIDASVNKTMPGHPSAWIVYVPASLVDGTAHKVYARALRSTGTVIGALDNATSAAPWSLKFAVSVSVPDNFPTPQPAPAVGAPSVVKVGDALIGANLPGTSAILVINGSFGISNSPQPIVNGAFRWPISDVAVGALAAYTILCVDNSGELLRIYGTFTR